MVAVIVGIWLWSRPPAGSVLEIARLTPLGAVPAGDIANWQSELVGAVDCDCIAVKPVDGSGSDRQFRLTGDVTPRQGGQILHTALTIPGAASPIWRGRHDVVAGDPAALTTAAQSIAATVMCIIGGTHDTPEPMRGEALRLWAAYCGAADQGLQGTRDREITLLQRAGELSPRSISIWMALATVLPETLPSGHPDWEAKALAPARQAAARALALAPRSGDALLASAAVQDPRDFIARERLIEAAIAAGNKGYGAQARGHLDRSVGRLADAERATRLSVDLQPWNDLNRLLLAETLRLSQNYGGAAAALAGVTDPERRARMSVSLAMVRRDWGAVQTAAMALPDSDYRRTLLALVTALAQGDAAGVRAAGDAMVVLASGANAGTPEVRALTAAGRPAEALAALDRLLGKGQPSGLLGVVYEPGFADVRRLPAFADMVRRRGLERYWTDSKRLPDFCLAADAPAPCPALRAAGAE